ncbi:RNA polymerase sigma factor [Achromobacter sp.]|uniref:RNA polymerase sigma factor n=1 Tax=Achromobacter sp. TaxID=134375 RepID=UPI003C706CAF
MPPQPSTWLAKYATMFRDWTRRSESPQEAEDALQEAALGMLKRQGAALADPCAYLYQASRNNLVSNLRKLGQRAGVPLHDLAEHEHPQSADVTVELDGIQLAHAIDAALRQLPEKCRQAYIWHRIDGLTQTEVAARLGLSLNTVERYIMRAMRHLRDVLQNGVSG